MNNREFFVDSRSSSFASRIIGRLRQQYDYAVNRQNIPLRTRLRFQVPEIESPLDLLGPGLAVGDVRADIRDFSTYLMLAKRRDTHHIRALNVGSLRVPLLPTSDLLEQFRHTANLVDADIAWGEEPVATTDTIDTIGFEEAEEIFFNGLSAFLATRIAGVAWMRSQEPPGYGGGGIGGLPGGGGGGGVVRPPPASPSRGGGGVFARMAGSGSVGFPGAQSYPGQWWDVHTQATGLTIYYCGTHAARNLPYQLGGVTTPLRLFLPLGTIFLAANAGIGGAIKWDASVVTVPSHSAVFTTKVF